MTTSKLPRFRKIINAISCGNAIWHVSFTSKSVITGLDRSSIDIKVVDLFTKNN